jgi:hypothetical protein
MRRRTKIGLTVVESRYKGSPSDHIDKRKLTLVRLVVLKLSWKTSASTQFKIGKQQQFERNTDMINFRSDVGLSEDFKIVEILIFHGCGKLRDFI